MLWFRKKEPLTKTFNVRVTQSTVLPVRGADRHTEEDAIQRVKELMEWKQGGTLYSDWEKDIRIER